MTEESKKQEIAILWQASRLTLTGEYVTAPEILCVHGSPIGTLGKFSASIGKAKLPAGRLMEALYPVSYIHTVR